MAEVELTTLGQDIADALVADDTARTEVRTEMLALHYDDDPTTSEGILLKLQGGYETTVVPTNFSSAIPNAAPRLNGDGDTLLWLLPYEDLEVWLGETPVDGNFMTIGATSSEQKTPEEATTALTAAMSNVTVTGTGEFDFTVTASTRFIIFAPVGGNMTLDDVTGLSAGQTIPFVKVQDTSDRTLTLAAGTNMTLGHTNALVMPSGSGALAYGTLFGAINAAGTVVPTLLEIQLD